MAEVLAEFSNLIAGDEAVYQARACGGPTDHGSWEGWIEFLPVGGGPAVRSPRETTQPNHGDLEYWAGGLSTVYLEGALERAEHPAVPTANG